MLDQLPLMSIVSALAIFVLISCLWVMAVVIWRARKTSQEDHVRGRLSGTADKSYAPPEVDAHTLSLWHKGEMKTTTVQGEVRQSRFIVYIDDMRNALGWTIPLSSFVFGIFGMCLFSFAIVLAVSGEFKLSVVAPVIVLYFISTYAKNRIAKEDMLFARQFQDALALATRSLRSGHPLMGAFQLIANECEAPISLTFGEIVQQQNLGKSLEDAIVEVSRRSRSSDLRLFAASTVIQIRSGGNVADMMERLADVIADRIRLDRKVKVLTSQTQLSKKVLMVIPLLLFLFMYIQQPDYIEPLFSTEVGNLLMVACFVLLFIGNIVMNKIAELDY